MCEVRKVHQYYIEPVSRQDYIKAILQLWNRGNQTLMAVSRKPGAQLQQTSAPTGSSMRITDKMNFPAIAAHGRAAALRRIIVVVHNKGGNLVVPSEIGE